MKERTINRGEVWWISVDDSIGSEQQTGRPVLVLSGDALNQKHGVYVAAYLTSSKTPEACRPVVYINGQERRVICNQIRTLDRLRFTKYMCTLSNDEMTKVLRALSAVFQLPVAPGRIEYTEELEDNEELLDLRVERDMYKRMYASVLNQLVDLRIEMDMAKRVVAVEEEPPVVEVAEVVEEPEPKPEVEEPPRILRKEVELNTCEMSDLLDIGVNEDVATRLIEGRPYKKIEDIRTVDGLTSMMYAVLSQVVKVVVVEEPPVVVVEEQPEVPEYTWDEFRKLPMSEQKKWVDYHRNELGEKETELAASLSVKVGTWYNHTSDNPELLRGGKKRVAAKVAETPTGGKVNINTATAKEFMEKLGMSKDYAYAITRHRKQNGLFGEIEELLLVDRFSKNKYEEYKAYFTLTDEVVEEQPEPPKKPEEPKKLDINLASRYELMQVGFNKTQAAKIVHSRKHKGPFRSIDDLLDVESVKQKDVRKLRDLLEV